MPRYVHRLMDRKHSDPVVDDLFRQLREITADHAKGLVDARGEPTELGHAMAGAQRVEPER